MQIRHPIEFFGCFFMKMKLTKIPISENPHNEGNENVRSKKNKSRLFSDKFYVEF